MIKVSSCSSSAFGTSNVLLFILIYCSFQLTENIVDQTHSHVTRHKKVWHDPGFIFQFPHIWHVKCFTVDFLLLMFYYHTFCNLDKPCNQTQQVWHDPGVLFQFLCLWHIKIWRLIICLCTVAHICLHADTVLDIFLNGWAVWVTWGSGNLYTP